MAISLSVLLIKMPNTEAATCSSSPCNTTFRVNVRETLAVQVGVPSSWATGDANQFLRNPLSVNVTTNNANGFTVSMYSKTSTNLTHTTVSGATIPTLSTAYTRSSFPANYWGYSLDDTNAGSGSSTYNPLKTSSNPITILTGAAGTTSGSKVVYFGAKANSSKAAGTYTNTIVINVVTGAINTNNPITPANPAKPNSTLNTATYSAAPTGSASGSTVYTYTGSSSGTNTLTTEVSEGNNVSAYSGYTPPQGVVEDTEMNVSNGSTLAATLATTASVAAASGMFFFIAAKRREDDDDEDTPQDVI